jgi:hypothetical protein
VSGIHCNGCEDVEIRDTTVGPSSTQVPALATFSNARFLLRYTKDLIPYGFKKEGFESLLNSTMLSLSGRGTRSAQKIFDELEEITKVYRDFHMGKEPR